MVNSYIYDIYRHINKIFLTLKMVEVVMQKKASNGIEP